MTHPSPHARRASRRGSLLFAALALVALCVFEDAGVLAQTTGAGNTNASSSRKRRPARRRARRKPAPEKPVAVIVPNKSVTIVGTRDSDPPGVSLSGKPTTVSGGVLNGKAISKPQPAYPRIALAARASGTVTVQIVVDEEGKVVSAAAVSGHPLLQQAAVSAARQARFSPTYLDGYPVKVSGVITYNFILE